MAQASQAQVLPSRIRSYLSECRSRGVTFSMPRIVAELQFQLAGVASPVAASTPLDLPLGDLAVFSEMGISLSLTTHS